MTSEQQQILQEAKEFASTYLDKKVNKLFVYHTLDHTSEVLRCAETIANQYNISDDDKFALMLAVWFHDTGYSEGVPMGHEEKSQSIAEEFLTQHKVEDQIINKVKNCIMATKMPQTPTNDIQRIICDADLDYLGRDDFFEIGDTLRREFLHYKIVSDNNTWEKLQLKFLQNHKYHTKASQKQREPFKQQNLSKLLV